MTQEAPGEPRLPVIALGGFLLAGVAGTINVAMLDSYHQSVSHMSGTVSAVGTAVGHGSGDAMGLMLGVISAFVCGAFASGVILGSDRLQHTAGYAVVLIWEAGLLTAAALAAGTGHAAVLLTAGACGLQNALASHWHGLNLRTTHMTGVLTDLGRLLAEAAHRRLPPPDKLTVLLALIAGFAGGGVLAAWSGLSTQLLLAGCALAVLGMALGYALWLRLGPQRPG